MLVTLTGLIVLLTSAVYVIAFVTGFYLVVSSFTFLTKLGDSPSQMGQQEFTVQSLITRMFFGAGLAISTVIAVATAISLGASTTEAVDPLNYLNYSAVSSGTTEADQILVFIKAVSRGIGSIALTSAIKNGANFNHPIELERKKARLRLPAGLGASILFLFPGWVASVVASSFPQLESVSRLLNSVP